MNNKQLARKIRDDLTSISVARTVNAAMKALDAIQGLPKADRVAGVAFLSMRMCEAFNMDFADTMQTVANISKQAKENGKAEYKGFIDYFKHSE